MGKVKLATPVLKWVGGKRQLLPEINKRIPKGFKTYYEPFLGGGAVLFDILSKKLKMTIWNVFNIYLWSVGIIYKEFERF